MAYQSRWQEECFGRCNNCTNCTQIKTEDGPYKRFVTMGSVRYGMRVGAVSPPPPGAGPRYRSQCCWPSSVIHGSAAGPVSRIPLITTTPINNLDIISCANRMRMTDGDGDGDDDDDDNDNNDNNNNGDDGDPTSELPQQTTVRNHEFYSTKCFKNQLKNCALVKPQIYTRLCEYADNYEQNIFNNLDRLPRFRFGGNRANNKTNSNSDHRLRDFTDRLKRSGPIPPPRIRHSSTRNIPSTTDTTVIPAISTTSTISRSQEPTNSHTTPFRSASFSQVDYNTDDRKYIKRKQSDNKEHEKYTMQHIIATLPRSKNLSRSTTYQQNFQKNCDEVNFKMFERVNQSQQQQQQQQQQQEQQQQKLMDTIEQSTDKLQNQSQPVVRDYMKSTINAQEKKRDKSRRRKGIYISQWPNEYQSNDMLPHLVQDSDFNNCSDQSAKLFQESIAEITKLQITDDKSKDFSIWSSPQEEPLSPEENNNPLEWTHTLKIDDTLSSLSPPPTPPPPPSSPLIAALQSESSPLSQRSRSLSPPSGTSTSISPPPPPPPPPLPLLPTQLKINLLRSDSLSEGEPEMNERKSDQQLTPSDISDCEGRTNFNNVNNKNNNNNDIVTPRRYSKRPLRGPYGQMLEAEMKKPERKLNSDLQFLEDLSKNDKKSTKCRNSCNSSIDTNCNYLNLKQQIQPLTKRKVSADSLVVDNEQKLIINHQRTTSSPSKLESLSNVQVSSELLEQLLRGSSEQLTTSNTNLQQKNDTRTHVVVELYENEKTYVESLEILVKKYLEPLKNPDNANLLDAALVDEIFNQIPALLDNHQNLLDELKKRLDHWDVKQKIGDVLLEMFSKQSVIENYTTYVNNWKKAREIIKNAQASKTAFARFLETTAREHKGKLALDSLLIKPIQKFPKYELLLTRLIKHTDINHPDHNLLTSALKAVHDQLLKINCIEREALELEQLREIENLIDGLINLVQTDRQYLRHDLVSMAARGGARKERALFLFSDLLLITKRKSGIRRPTTGGGGVGVGGGGVSSVTNSFESNKYKLLMKISLDDLEIVKSKDENLKQIMLEIENLTEDVNIVNQINELCWSLHCNHTQLDDVVKDMLTSLNKQLTEQQNSDSQLCCLDLTLNTTNTSEIVSIVFSKPEKRISWEESFTDAKNKLVSGDRRPSPELLATVPIRKTRAGLQFTCAAPTLSDNCKDVWVCNSDGYVGQICVLSLQPEPTVTSCNGVCNARILCIASVPGISYRTNNNRQDTEQHKTIHFDSSSSSDEDDKSDYGDVIDTQKMSESDACSIDIDDIDSQQSTMWLGTEDRSIHIYNSSDNIRIKKNKLKLQYNSSVLCIVYVDNRVFVSLSNGDVMIYDRDNTGGWAINAPITVTVSSSTLPVTKMLPNNGKLLCSCGNTIKIFNTQTLITENSFQINNDTNKPITCIVLFGNGIWLSLQNSAIVRCFHILTFENLYEINVAPAVTKMLTSCDDIIRQHKAACLRVTSLLACKDLLWIGTSAGVLLTMPLPHIGTKTTKITNIPIVNGVPYGHTGHVRFLTYIELNNCETHLHHQSHRNSYRGKPEQRNNTKLLVISGGDGYEDFRNSNLSEIAGREDSTNHLLLWNI